MNKIFFSITAFICGVFFLQQERALLANDDPWLLFRHAQTVVAGEVTEILQEERDLLYHLTADTPGNLLSGSPVIWWREPEGAGTEGIGAQTGTRGAWLVAAESDDLYPIHVATLLPRGFFHMNDFSQLDDLRLLLKKEPQYAAALRLIESPDRDIRRIAIGWWSRTDLKVTADQQRILENKFSMEIDPACQRSWLNLYLSRDWKFEAAGLSELVPHSPDGTVSWLTLRYLEKSGTTRQRARLISSWLNTDTAGKAKLAIAFRKLNMRETHPWLIQEISTSRGELRLLCIETLAATGDSKSETVIESLLQSDCGRTREAVLRGLAKSNAPRGFEILRQKVQDMNERDPLYQRAKSLQSAPKRVQSFSGK